MPKHSNSYYKNLFNQYKNKQNTATQNSINTANTITSSNNTQEDTSNTKLNWWENIVGGMQSFSNSIKKGIMSSVEGVGDLITKGVAGVASIFSDEASQAISDFADRDLTQEFLDSDFYYWTNDMGADLLTGNIGSKKVSQNMDNILPDIVDSIGEGIGQVGLQMALAIATGGTSTAGTALSYGLMGASAAGNSMTQASKEGASLGEQFGYGLLSGATEVGSEIIGDKLIGPVLSKIGGKASNVGVKKIITDSIGEGLEEVISDVAQPVSQMLTYKQGSSYSELFEENGGVEGLASDFISAAITSGLFGGADLALEVNKSGSYENAKQVQQAGQYIQELQELNEEEAQVRAQASEFTEENFQKAIQMYETKRTELKNEITKLASDWVDNVNSKRIDTSKMTEEEYNDLSKAEKQQVYRQQYADELTKQSNMTGESINKAIYENAADSIGLKANVVNDNTTTPQYNPNTKEFTLNQNVIWDENTNQTRIATEEEMKSKDYDTKRTKSLYKQFVHEVQHAVNSDELVDTIVKNVDTNQKLSNGKTLYEQYKEDYKDEINALKQKGTIKDSADERKYINQEIAGDYLSKYITNVDDFVNSIRGEKESVKNKILRRLKSLIGKKDIKLYNEIRDKLTKGANESADIATKAKEDTIKEVIKKTTKKSISGNTILDEDKIKENKVEENKKAQEKKETSTNEDTSNIRDKKTYKPKTEETKKEHKITKLTNENATLSSDLKGNKKLTKNFRNSLTTNVRALFDIISNGSIPFNTSKTKFLSNETYTNIVNKINTTKNKDTSFWWHLGEEILNDYKFTDTKGNEVNITQIAESLGTSSINDLDYTKSVFGDYIRELYENAQNSTKKNYEDKIVEIIDKYAKQLYDTKVRNFINRLNERIISNAPNSKASNLTDAEKQTIVDAQIARANIVDDRKTLDKIKDSIKTLDQRKINSIITVMDSTYGTCLDIRDNILAKNPDYTKEEAMYCARVLVQQVRSASNKAVYMIQNDLVDLNGKPLYEEITIDGKTESIAIKGLRNIVKGMDNSTLDLFNEYLLHEHNVDRMSIENKRTILDKQIKEYKETTFKALKNELVKDPYNSDKIKAYVNGIKELNSMIKKRNSMKNKPVFDENVDADYSRKRADEILKSHPEFKERAKEIYAYLQYQLDLSVQSGRLTQEQKEYMREYYPHYVPTFRETETSTKSTSGMNSNLQVSKTTKNATGGNEKLQNTYQAIENMTLRNARADALNLVVEALDTNVDEEIDYFAEDLDTTSFDSLENDEKAVGANDKYFGSNDKNINISYYKNGQYKTIQVTAQVATGVLDLQSQFRKDITDLTSLHNNIFQKIMKAFKGLVTNYNPFFIFRNMIRDNQDALLYTKYGAAKFQKNLARAYKEITTKGYYWKLYQQYGGLSGSLFDLGNIYKNESVESIRAKLKKGITLPTRVIESVNLVVEQAPRLAEFISSIESQLKEFNGDMSKVDIARAVYDAQDVTVNFGIHGSSKTVKWLNTNFIPFLNAQIQGSYKIGRTFLGGKPTKELASLLFKALLFGIGLSVLNDMLYSDDDDYEAIGTYYKSNYFLIKIGGNFIKIPKGRINALLSTLMYDTKEAVDNETLVSIDTAKTLVSDSWDTLAPISGINTILDPIWDANNNVTWYGGTIVSSKYDNVRTANQYDTSTSSIAIGIGKAFNISPLKVEYVLEQYTGVVGDFVLPATSTKGQAKGIASMIKESIVDTQMIDTTYQNKYSSDFYDLLQELKYQSNEGNLYGKAELKYMNAIKTRISDLNDEINEIAIDTSITNKERDEKTEILQTSVNLLYKQATETAKVLREKLEEKNISEETYENDYYNSLYEVLGAESTLEMMDSSIYERSVELNEIGIDYDTYYTYYMYTKGYDKEYKVEYIERMNLSKNQKYLLYLISGYSIPSAYKARLKAYIKKSSMSDEYKETLLNKLS